MRENHLEQKFFYTITERLRSKQVPTPARIHEVAAAQTVSMTDVFTCRRLEVAPRAAEKPLLVQTDWERPSR